MTRTRSASQRTSDPKATEGPSRRRSASSTEPATVAGRTAAPAPAARASADGETAPAASGGAAGRGRRNPPRSSRGSKNIGRDYSDLVRSRSVPGPSGSGGAGESQAATRSGRAPSPLPPLLPPPPPPPPPPPAITLRTVIVDGVIKEARCELFKAAAPTNTKLTLRRTKHGWAAASGAVSKHGAKHGAHSKHAAPRRPPSLMKVPRAVPPASKSSTAVSATPPTTSKTSKSSTVTSETSNGSPSTVSAASPAAASVSEVPASASVASETSTEAAPEDNADTVGPDVDDNELTARLKQLYSRNRSASSSDARSARADSGSSAGRTEEAAREDSVPRFTASVVTENGDSGDTTTQKGDSVDEEIVPVEGPVKSECSSVKTECAVSISTQPKLELMATNDEPLVYPPPVIAVPKIRLGGPAATGAGAARTTQPTASSSPMLASLLDSSPAPDPARPPVPLSGSEKSCELLKHLLSTTPKESPPPPPPPPAATLGAPETTKAPFKLKFHNRDPVTFRIRPDKMEPAERTASPLDPRCKLTPSPVRTPPTAAGSPSGTLWNFLNDPKMGIPELLLIPLTRLKALLSQPIDELVNLSTFTMEAVKYVGWHPAFRQVDILQVSRDRLYKLLKDPRSEVKKLLTDPSARLFPCSRPGGGGGWGPRGPTPDVAALGAGRTAASAASPTTNSLLRQKLMTRGGVLQADLGAHCQAGFSPAARGGGGGGDGGGGVDVAIGYRAPPVLTPLAQATRVQVATRPTQEQHLLSLLKQPLNKATFLTDEVTIRPISQAAVAASASLKRSLPDLIPRQNKRRAPPGLRPLVQPAPQLQPTLPPCPDDSDADEDTAMLAAGLVQACLGDEAEEVEGTAGSQREALQTAEEETDLGSGLVNGVGGDDPTAGDGALSDGPESGTPRGAAPEDGGAGSSKSTAEQPSAMDVADAAPVPALVPTLSVVGGSVAVGGGGGGISPPHPASSPTDPEPAAAVDSDTAPVGDGATAGRSDQPPSACGPPDADAAPADTDGSGADPTPAPSGSPVAPGGSSAADGSSSSSTAVSAASPADGAPASDRSDTGAESVNVPPAASGFVAPETSGGGNSAAGEDSASVGSDTNHASDTNAEIVTDMSVEDSDIASDKPVDTKGTGSGDTQTRTGNGNAKAEDTASRATVSDSAASDFSEKGPVSDAQSDCKPLPEASAPTVSVASSSASLNNVDVTVSMPTSSAPATSVSASVSQNSSEAGVPVSAPSVPISAAPTLTSSTSSVSTSPATTDQNPCAASTSESPPTQSAVASSSSGLAGSLATVTSSSPSSAADASSSSAVAAEAPSSAAEVCATPSLTPAAAEVPNPASGAIEALESAPATPEDSRLASAVAEARKPAPTASEVSKTVPAASEAPKSTREASEAPTLAPATTEASGPAPTVSEDSKPAPPASVADKATVAASETPTMVPAAPETPKPTLPLSEPPKPALVASEALVPVPATLEAPEPSPTTSEAPKSSALVAPEAPKAATATTEAPMAATVSSEAPASDGAAPGDVSATDDAESGDEEDRLVIIEDEDNAPDALQSGSESAPKPAGVTLRVVPARRYGQNSAMMTTGTSDGSAVTMEVKENGHQHNPADSEDGANKVNESSNIQTTPKEDKQENDEMDIAVETRPTVENGQSSPGSAPAAPPPPAASEPSPPSPPQQPIAAAAAGATVAAAAAQSTRKRSVEPVDDGPAKKARVDPAERATPLTPDIACLRTVELIESSLHKLKREVKAIDLLARQKEKEWDNLLKLRKAKEEAFQRLRRKREVLLMQQSDEAATLAQRVASGPASGGSAPVAAPAPSPASTATSLVQQQLLQQHKQKQQQQQHQQQAAAQQAQRAAAAVAALSAQSSHGLRPIRPAYGGGGGGGGSGGGRIGQGMGPQGPTISVQHLIDRHAADYRRRSELAVPLPATSSPAGQQDPQYREMLAQIAKLSKAPTVAGGTGEVTIHQVTGPAADAGASQPMSSLAKLLLESKMKQVEPSVVSEMLKRRPTGGPLSSGVLQSPQPQVTIRSPAPRVSVPTAAPPPPPPPPPPTSEEVPLCQGCQQRQAQFVCAGCGHQWYCSRDCQVEAWDSHADDCSG